MLIRAGAHPAAVIPWNIPGIRGAARAGGEDDEDEQLIPLPSHCIPQHPYGAGPTEREMRATRK